MDRIARIAYRKDGHRVKRGPDAGAYRFTFDPSRSEGAERFENNFGKQDQRVLLESEGEAVSWGIRRNVYVPEDHPFASRDVVYVPIGEATAADVSGSTGSAQADGASGAARYILTGDREGLVEHLMQTPGVGRKRSESLADRML